MTDETIVAIYDTPAHAELAAQDLKASGMLQSAISLHAAVDSQLTAAAAPLLPPEIPAGRSGSEPDNDPSARGRSLAARSTAVTVKVAEGQASSVIDLLESHMPVDIDQRATIHAVPPVPQPGKSTI